ncbi:MAG: phosphoenolpyruvate carboxykinase (ATP), partial [Deltaproteobacteria bacterium]|nr:phosphoenolpyruvate carboxykinase (ATP) [Deltaproteobacteria bacterium]
MRQQVLQQLSTDALIEAAVKRNEGELADNGALVVRTGKYTGRSPQDRYIVQDETTGKEVAWGTINRPMAPGTFEKLLRQAEQYLQGRQIFVRESYACADPTHRFPIRVKTEFAWHNLFAQQLFLRYRPDETIPQTPAMTILSAPNALDNSNYIIINFSKRIILIAGTQYAGEIKKSIFSTLNFLLPGEGVLTMHCSANVGEKKDVALFFGLSGTGKTSL